MFEAFRVPEYGRQNRIVAAVLGSFVLLFVLTLVLLRVDVVYAVSMGIAIAGLMLAFRWVMAGVFVGWYGQASIGEALDSYTRDGKRDRHRRARRGGPGR